MLENIQVQQVKASFSYFAALYQKLVTDAISAIRSLANSILSLYLQLLKKEVAEARLRAVSLCKGAGARAKDNVGKIEFLEF